ncbi:hypothetical protein C7N43_37520 [Sphingobacteriales bacterium UPWRP_1]|nr:hypothetical protein B6N25_00330 [Sphingobacteriales bacterium TSM_CSS]PSJ71789.1 hypothetical protein C7N43_37520 [Sphingobacteriales bacterium UPWRP_1]
MCSVYSQTTSHPFNPFQTCRQKPRKDEKFAYFCPNFNNPLTLQKPTRFYRATHIPAAVIAFALFCTALPAGIYGCRQQTSGNSVPNEQASGTTIYFNLNRFFNQEITRLENSKTGLQKTATLNQKAETKILKDVNWRKELAAFTASDINKPAWKGKYAADTTRQNGFTTVTYTATDIALRTRLVQLNFKDGSNNPVSVVITNQTNNFVYQTNENLHYQTGGGYNIKASQKVILMQPENFAIAATFVKP